MYLALGGYEAADPDPMDDLEQCDLSALEQSDAPVYEKSRRDVEGWRGMWGGMGRNGEGDQNSQRGTGARSVCHTVSSLTSDPDT